MAQNSSSAVPEFMRPVVADEPPASAQTVAERAVLALNTSSDGVRTSRRWRQGGHRARTPWKRARCITARLTRSFFWPPARPMIRILLGDKGISNPDTSTRNSPNRGISAGCPCATNRMTTLSRSSNHGWKTRMPGIGLRALLDLPRFGFAELLVQSLVDERWRKRKFPKTYSRGICNRIGDCRRDRVDG